MLKNIWYQDTLSLLNFLSKLPQEVQAQKIVSVFCPDPLTADKLREQLGEGFVVETISAGLKRLGKENNLEDIEIYRKSGLLFELWIAWKKFGLKNSFNLFNNCFNLVTELRGFSLNTDQVIDLLENTNEEQFNGVCFLLRYYQERQLHDENSIYHSFSTQKLALGNRGAVIFYGFKHLSGNQIDMLINIAEEVDVYVPIPSEVKEHLTFSDWPQWLLENGESLVLESDQGRPEVSVVLANNFLANKYLVNRLKDNKQGSLFFWDRKELQRKVLELPSACIQAKIPTDLFGSEVKELEKELTKRETVDLEALVVEMEDAFKAESEEKNKNYRKLKVLYDFYENLKSLSAYGIEQVERQDLLVLFEKTRLDLPRNSLVWQNESQQMKVGTFSEAMLDNSQLRIFVLDANLSFDSSNNLDDSLNSQLASLGPIRNSQLDFLFNKSSINALTGNGEVVLLADETVFEKTSLFDEYKENRHEEYFTSEFLLETKRSYSEGAANTASLKVSPSRLQTYIDCPYRYYLQYVERFKSLNTISSDYLVKEEGTVAHGVLARSVPLLLEKKDFNLDEMIDEELEKFGKNLRFKFRENAIRKSSLRSIELSQNEFKKLPDGVLTNVIPEERFNDDKYEGTLDLLLKSSSEECFIFDYKKSDGSIPIESDILKGQVVQLTLYSKFFAIDKIGAIGYLCLEKPDKSLILFNPNSAHAHWLQENGFYQGAKWKPLSIEKLQEIHEIIDTRRQELDEQDYFEAKPRKAAVCTFCDYSSFCVRGE